MPVGENFGEPGYVPPVPVPSRPQSWSEEELTLFVQTSEERIPSITPRTFGRMLYHLVAEDPRSLPRVEILTEGDWPKEMVFCDRKDGVPYFTLSLVHGYLPDEESLFHAVNYRRFGWRAGEMQIQSAVKTLWEVLDGRRL